jgi:hypothetical protein
MIESPHQCRPIPHIPTPALESNRITSLPHPYPSLPLSLSSVLCLLSHKPPHPAQYRLPISRTLALVYKQTTGSVRIWTARINARLAVLLGVRVGLWTFSLTVKMKYVDALHLDWLVQYLG